MAVPSAQTAVAPQPLVQGGRCGAVAPALVHDWLNQPGGAEVVLGVLHGLLPTAPIYTSIYDPGRVELPGEPEVRTSWMDRLPGIHSHHQPYLPLYPLAWDTMRLGTHDLVLSNKSGFCHGVRVGSAIHVCYCLTPTRFVWQAEEYIAHERVGSWGRLALRSLSPWLRRWDRAAADRVDRFVAISSAVRDRIHQVYARESTVIHPPVDTSAYYIGQEVDDFYLVLARLVPYKRIDLAVQAFTRMGRKLVIVGDGRDRDRLVRLAGPTVEFRGRLPRSEVAALLSRCRGLIWPGEEDFGLAPVEAMASGRPVVARRAGGVLDTVVEGRTGVFFDLPETEALADAVERADRTSWEPAAIRRHAGRFDRAVFESRLSRFLADSLLRGKAEGG